jgi:chorismate dehydratase
MRISAVSYINTRPFVYGLKNYEGLNGKVELSEDIPSVCASKLMEGKAEVGLVPVAAIPRIPGARIFSNLCIGAEGKVRTVGILSDVPLEEVEEIMLDYQSNTSVALCRILCRDHWKIQPKFSQTTKGYEELIEGKRAAVVIGDRVFRQEGKHKYFYDLSEEWTRWTGLPFAFACWVVVGEQDEELLKEVDNALAYGLEHMEASIDDVNADRDLIIDYLMWNISYNFDAPKKKALDRFLSLLKTLD